MHNVVKKYQWHFLGIMLVIAVVLVTHLTAAQVTAYQVLVDGKAIAYIKSRTMVNETVANLQKAQEKSIRTTVNLVNRVDTNRTRVDKKLLISENELNQMLKEKLTFEQNAVWIVIDGKQTVALATKDDADQTMEQIKQDKIVLQPGEKLVDSRFVQNVCFLYYPVSTKELKSVKEAKQILLASSQQTIACKVQDGDNLWDIAKKYKVYVGDIMDVNQMSSDKIKPDEVIKIPLTRPLLTLVAQINGSKQEAIPFNTRVINDPRVRGTQVVTRGVAGIKQVSYTTTRNNGVVVAYNVTASKVLKSPVEQVEKHRTVYQIASRGVSTGGWIWPVIGTITSPFGGARDHTGLDIAAPIGRPIRASRAGKVIFAGSSNGYGLNVVIDHGAGYVTRYAHCSQLYVQVGDSVQAGEVIAAIGVTGHTTGPHLHFEILYQDKFINPATALRG